MRFKPFLIKGQPRDQLAEVWDRNRDLDQLADRFLPGFLAQHPKVNVRLSAGTPNFAAWTAATVSLWFEDPPQMGEFAIKLTDVPFALYAAQGANPCAQPWVAI